MVTPTVSRPARPRKRLWRMPPREDSLLPPRPRPHAPIMFERDFIDKFVLKITEHHLARCLDDVGFYIAGAGPAVDRIERKMCGMIDALSVVLDELRTLVNRSGIDLERRRLFLLAAETEPTITPEQTLREAGIGRKRQAAYQRKMSTLLAGRAGEA
jgi:hypothetical protein